MLFSTTPASHLILSVHKLCCLFSNVCLTLPTLPIYIAAFMVHQPSPVLFPQFSHICSCHPTLSTSISHTAARRLFLPKTQSRKCYALCCGSGCSWQHILAQPAACWVNQPRGLSKSVLCASLLVFSESWAIESLPHL